MDHPPSNQPTNPRTLSAHAVHHLLPNHLFLNLRDSQRRIQSLRTRPAAVQNRVAAVQRHAVLERLQTLILLLVAAVGDPAVGLQKDGRAEVLLAVPPIAGAGSRAAGAEDAFVEAIELTALGFGLAVLTALQSSISADPLRKERGEGWRLTSGAGVFRCRYGLMDRYCL